MRTSTVICASSLALVVAGRAAAQSVPILQSAETMDKGTFKLLIAPALVFGKDGADDEFGIAARGGYAFGESFDAEAKLAFYENTTVVGADGELWLVKAQAQDSGVDFSVSAGLHFGFGSDDAFDTMGIEVTPAGSIHVSEKVEICAALDASFEKISDVPEGFDDSFTVLHLTPGIEYGVSEDADIEGEVGIALNDDTSTYIAAGIVFYFR